MTGYDFLSILHLHRMHIQFDILRSRLHGGLCQYVQDVGRVGGHIAH